MMRMNERLSNDLFLHEIRYLYSAETQLMDALPKIAESTTNTEVQNVLKKHIQKSAYHLERLKKIGASMNFDITGETCYATKALIDEVNKILQYSKTTLDITDTALLMACMRLEKYEIARYKCALYLALQMGYTSLALMLHLTLSEEKEADALLTNLALEQVERNQQKEKMVPI